MKRNLCTRERINLLIKRVKRLCYLNAFVYVGLLACMGFKRLDIGVTVFLFPFLYLTYVLFKVSREIKWLN